MVRSMMAHYDQSVHHMLPVWSHYANENWCMIGYHSVSVLADAMVTGNLTGAEANTALDAAVQTAKTGYYDGLEYYMKLGYVPEDKNSSSVSKTLEYAFDDWTIAQMAKKLNRQDIYDEFIKRSGNWKNVYDSSTGFMRPKVSDGKFLENFDPLKTEGQGFIEGNSWNYSLYVPHEPDAMIAMMGGKANLRPTSTSCSRCICRRRFLPRPKTLRARASSADTSTATNPHIRWRIFTTGPMRRGRPRNASG